MSSKTETYFATRQNTDRDEGEAFVKIVNTLTKHAVGAPLLYSSPKGAVEANNDFTGKAIDYDIYKVTVEKVETTL